MRKFVQKEDQRKKPALSNLARPGTTTPRANYRTDPVSYRQSPTWNQSGQPVSQTPTKGRDAGSRFSHDFMGVPLLPPAKGVIQAKQAINTPGDRFEQEADRITERVMRMPEPHPKETRFRSDDSSKCCEQQGAHRRPKTLPVRQHDTGEIVPPIVNDAMTSPSQPLDTETQSFFAQRFGHDFSHVRIHTDVTAAASARAINAIAYTVGHDIFYGAGQTPGMDRLTAHELSHVLQHGNARNRGEVPMVQREAATSPALTREDIIRDLRQRVVERAVQKSIEIGEALRNGYIWPAGEFVPGESLAVEVLDQWDERNRILQELILWLGELIERLRAGDSFNNLLPSEIDQWIEQNVREGTPVSADDVHIFFYGEAGVFVHDVHNVPTGNDPASLFIGRVLMFSPDRTPVLPPSLRTGQPPTTPTPPPSPAVSGPPQPQPRAPGRATTSITGLWVEVPEPYAHPEVVSGILTTYQASFRQADRPTAPRRFELFIVGGTCVYDRGDRRVWLPDLPRQFRSLRQRFPSLREQQP